MTMQQFITTNKIRITVDWAADNPNMANDEWARTAHHFKCVLRRKRQRLTITFSQGSAVNGEPKAADVLDCLASDASGVDNARSFEDWCAEYGYDVDSRKAEKIYKTCATQAEKLKQFLGTDAYETLLWSIERL